MLCTLQHLHTLLKTFACRRTFLPHQAGVPQRRARQCTALAVLFNRQATKKGQQVDAQGCRLKLCGFAPLIKVAWRAAFSPTVHATVLRKCGHVPFTMKAAYEQLALVTKQDAERDGFRRDGAEDLTGDAEEAAPGQCDWCGIKKSLSSGLAT